MATATCLTACHAGNLGLLGKKRPIKKETTAIHYSIHTNSGIAVQTDYDITPDSITWLYRDRRNGFILRDVVKYDPKDYDALIDTLSQVAFKVRHVKSNTARGGGFMPIPSLTLKASTSAMASSTTSPLATTRLQRKPSANSSTPTALPANKQ